MKILLKEIQIPTSSMIHLLRQLIKSRMAIRLLTLRNPQVVSKELIKLQRHNKLMLLSIVQKSEKLKNSKLLKKRLQHKN